MSDKGVLLTGGSGFLGKVIIQTLPAEYTVKTLGRSSRSDYRVDLASTIPSLSDSFFMVIHAAGKAHVVPRTRKAAADFFTVNVIGTKNLLTGLECAPSLPERFVFISSVAVYGATEGSGISEWWPLAGTTPYAKSKIQAEEVVTDWCARHRVRLTILRLPLLVGKGAPGNLGDMIRLIRKGWYVGTGRGEARKSMVLAEDIARFIPQVAALGGIYNLTDGYHPSVGEVEHALATALGRRRVIRLPYRVLLVVAKLGDVLGSWFPLNTSRLKKLDSFLTFSDEKARQTAGWNPRSVLAHLTNCL